MKNSFFSWSTQDEHDSTPFIKKPINTHTKITSHWVSHIDPSPIHSSIDSEVLVTKRFDKDDDGSRYLRQLINS